MPHLFRVTCARTSYVDIDVEAEDGISAEQIAEAALASDAAFFEQGRPVAGSVYRIIEVTAVMRVASAGDTSAAAA